jgi:predicted nuclease with RNAse H fold
VTLERWAGVDVGARKGFDVAVIDRHGLIAGPERIAEPSGAVAWLVARGPGVVAVDSPRRPAPAGQLSRSCERDLVAARVCGIRYTPDEEALAKSAAYYAWVRQGFALYDSLATARLSTGWEVIECFPTAAWSRLGGPRGTRTRARWSQAVLERLALHGLPARLGQDGRDAIGAALTARLYAAGGTERFGEIVVPRT